MSSGSASLIILSIGLYDFKSATKLLNFHKKIHKITHLYSRIEFFRNFGFAELTMHSEMKRKISFPFAFLSFFCNFALDFE